MDYSKRIEEALEKAEIVLVDSNMNKIGKLLVYPDSIDVVIGNRSRTVWNMVELACLLKPYVHIHGLE